MKNKVSVYYALIIVLIILIGICSFFTFYFYDIKDNNLSSKNISITEQNKMNYSVKIKDDNFYKVGEETTFITSMLEKINLYYNYSLAFSSIVEGEYSYYIIGNIHIKNDTSDLTNEIYKSDISNNNVSGNIISISNNFDIDFQNILNSYNQFKNNNNLNVDGYIEYNIVIDYAVYSEKINKNFKDRKVLTINMPIKDLTNINLTKDQILRKIELSEINKKDKVAYYIICLEFFGADVIFVLLIILIVKRLKGRVTIYEYELNKIIKKYNNKLINLKSLPDLTDYEIFFVKTFDDLLNISHDMKLPINMIEVVKNHASTFMILYENKAYVYKLDSKYI